MDPRIEEVCNNLATILENLLGQGFQNFNGIRIIIPETKYQQYQLDFFQSMRDENPELAASTDDELGAIFYNNKTPAQIKTDLEALGVDTGYKNLDPLLIDISVEVANDDGQTINPV